MTAADVAEVIHVCGTDSTLIETGYANILRSGVSPVKRTVFDLCQPDVDEEDIRTVALEDPRHVFSLGE